MPRGVDRSDEARHQGRLWTPAELRGNAQLLRWYDADVGPFTVPTAALVSQWNDKSGFASHLTQSGGTTFTPTLVGKSMQFPTGGGQLRVLEIPTLPSSGWDMAMVGLPHSSASYRSMLHNNGADDHQILIEQTTNALGAWDTTFRQFGSLTWPAQLGLLYGSWQSSTNIRVSRDGGALSTAAAGSVNIQSNLFGSSSFTDQGFGTVYEAVFMSPGQSDAAKKRVEGYLAWKWTRLGIGDVVGLLPGTHSFKNRPPLIGD